MKEKVLIFRNEQAISTAIRKADYAHPFLQTTCTELSKITQNYSLDTIIGLIMKMPNSAKDLEQIVKKIIINNSEPTVINGHSIKVEAFANLIQVPDCTALYNSLNQLFSACSEIKYNINQYYTLTDNVVSKTIGLVDIITEEFSYYTKNDKQVDFMEKATAFINSINDLKPFIFYPQLGSKIGSIECFKYNGRDENITIKEGFVHSIV